MAGRLAADTAAGGKAGSAVSGWEAAAGVAAAANQSASSLAGRDVTQPQRASQYAFV